MSNVCINRINELVEDIQTFKKHLARVNAKGTLVLKEGDKKELDNYNFSDEIEEVNEALKQLLSEIVNTMDEIYGNAVDEREGYPEDSTVKRALWLDDIQNTVSSIGHLASHVFLGG